MIVTQVVAQDADLVVSSLYPGMMLVTAKSRLAADWLEIQWDAPVNGLEWEDLALHLPSQMLKEFTAQAELEGFSVGLLA